MNAVSPCTTWLRFSLVTICTVSGSPTPRRLHRFAFRHRANEVAAEADEGVDLVVEHRLAGGRPCSGRSSRGGAKSYCSARRSSGASSGFSVMPTVRWPCTLEWPRTGQMPAPGLPILPRSSSRLTSICTVRDALDVLRQAHAVDADNRLGPGVHQRRRFHRVAGQSGAAFQRGPVSGAHRVSELLEAVRVLVDEVPVQHGRCAIAMRRPSAISDFAHAHDGGHVAARSSPGGTAC